jgi:hypothetical protein
VKKKGVNVEWLPVSALHIDERVQRAIIAPRVRHLVSNFVPEKVNTPPLVVSLRADGRYYVLDGSHRVTAARKAGYGELRVKCEIHHNLTLPQEGALFLSANDSRPVSPVDKYRIGLVAGDPATQEIEGIIAGFGLRVASNSSDGVVRCVDALYRLHAKNLLEETLEVTTAAFGTRSEALEQLVLRGISEVVGRYNGQLDRPALVKKLSKRSGAAAGLIADARALSAIRPISKSRALAEIVVDTYNKGRRGDSGLPPL